jgi:hypothetical protein
MDLWLAGPETAKILEKAIAEWHPDLALVSDQIAVVMRDPAAKSGGVVNLGTSRKASPLVRALGKEQYIFILEVAAEEWRDMDDNKRLALIDHLLCQCGVKEDEKKDTITYTILKPEIQMFKANLRRFGVWMDISDEDDDGDHAATTIESMFGKEAVAKRKAQKKGDGKVTIHIDGSKLAKMADPDALDNIVEGGEK